MFVGCGSSADPDARLEMSTWRRNWTDATWRKFLEEGETEAELFAIRRRTHTGRPLADTAFTEALEALTLRRLQPGHSGRPRKPAVDESVPILRLN